MTAPCPPRCNGTWPAAPGEPRRPFHVRGCPNDPAVECPDCGGDGYSDPRETCPTCGHEARRVQTCERCHGVGLIVPPPVPSVPEGPHDAR